MLVLSNTANGELANCSRGGKDLAASAARSGFEQMPNAV
jgi:hypothetical protein